MAGRSGNVFQGKEALDAFNNAINTGATEVEANNAAMDAHRRATSKATAAKKEETKAVKSSLSGLAKAGAALALTGGRAGLQHAVTTGGSFETGFQNFIQSGAASVTGIGQRERGAILSAGDQTSAFFADAVRAGADIPTAQRNQMLDFFRQREDRVQDFERGLAREVGSRAAAAGTEAWADALLSVDRTLKSMWAAWQSGGLPGQGGGGAD